jgi:N-carbamoyl-L-amino-acid hydrolase
MPSGAGHDAMVLSRHLSTGMLFIPSIGGRSHDVAEDSHEADILLGADVLADAVLGLARQGGEVAG